MPAPHVTAVDLSAMQATLDCGRTCPIGGMFDAAGQDTEDVTVARAGWCFDAEDDDFYSFEILASERAA